jgi:hypothetical protein
MEHKLISGFLEQETCDILEEHLRLQKEAGRCRYANVNGLPQGKSFDLYGDSFCEAIGIYKTPVINKYTGKTLSLTYGLMREYEKGASLRWHRDRWQCEYSITVQVSKGVWPMHFTENYIGGLWEAQTSVILQRGDAIFYKGCEIYHSRNVLPHKTSRHLFLHYVEKNSALDNKDNRIGYGTLEKQEILKDVSNRKRGI